MCTVLEIELRTSKNDNTENISLGHLLKLQPKTQETIKNTILTQYDVTYLNIKENTWYIICQDRDYQFLEFFCMSSLLTFNSNVIVYIRPRPPRLPRNPPPFAGPPPYGADRNPPFPPPPAPALIGPPPPKPP